MDELRVKLQFGGYHHLVEADIKGFFLAGSFIVDVAITPDSTAPYVTDIASNSNSVFVIATILVGLFPLSIAITPDGTRAYVT